MGCCKSMWSPFDSSARKTVRRSLSVEYNFGCGDPEQDIVTAYSADAESPRGSILKLNHTDFGYIFDMLCNQRDADNHKFASTAPSALSTHADGSQSITSDRMTMLPNVLYTSESEEPYMVKNQLSLNSETTASHGGASVDTPPYMERKDSGMAWHLAPSVASNVSASFSPFVSVESVTDRALTAIPSCQGKEIKLQGSRWQRPDIAAGYACKKGHKVDLPNQDSFLIVRSESLYSIFGVFDGHGPFGHDISNFVKEQLPRVLLVQPDLKNDMAGCLKFAFQKTQCLLEEETTADRLDAHRSGTTVSLVVQNHATGDLHVAHVGDSRCVLGSIDADGEVASEDVTRDHKPELQDEKERIQQAGGEVRIDSMKVHRVYAKGKLYPALSMSRALGDLTGFRCAGISPEPDVRQLDQRIAISGDTSVSYTSEAFGGQESIQTVWAESSPRYQNAGADVTWKSLSSKTAGKLPPLVWPSEDGKPSHSVDGKKEPQASLASSIPHDGVPKPTGVKGGMGTLQASASSLSRGTIMRFLLICSDGVWEYVTSQEAVDIVARFSPEEAMQAAESLSFMAWDRWHEQWQGEVVDDITVLVVHLK